MGQWVASPPGPGQNSWETKPHCRSACSNMVNAEAAQSPVTKVTAPATRSVGRIQHDAALAIHMLSAHFHDSAPPLIDRFGAGSHLKVLVRQFGKLRRKRPLFGPSSPATGAAVERN
ncbi:hypothetical protein G7Y89_g6967 [Cudoniella acicularis]|uniref:Uncharacterized protein n=1 Tax=Cudoniella acicularis TaxID=354080 RepID=A0A8H4RLP2_9HELO|nr:hypothetical protein G7Y89_g6967 [Cudoniella acicularis]